MKVTRPLFPPQFFFLDATLSVLWEPIEICLNILCIIILYYVHVHTVLGGVIGLIATPIGAAIGAGVGALIGGGAGFLAGLAGGAGAGVGVAHKLRSITLTCTAEDIFQCLEMSSNFRKEGDRVFVEITGSFECEGSHTQTLLQETEQLQVENA